MAKCVNYLDYRPHQSLSNVNVYVYIAETKTTFGFYAIFRLNLFNIKQRE